MTNLKLEIENIGPINKADIGLGKLNVVGGINGSGKSTATKLLYCFLLASSREGENVYRESLRFELRSIGDFLEDGIIYDNEIKNFSFNNFELTKQENEELFKATANVRRTHTRIIEEKSEEIFQSWYDLINLINIDSKDFYYNYLDKVYYNFKNRNLNYKFYIILKYIFYHEFGYRIDFNKYGLGTAKFIEKSQDKDISWTLYVGEDGYNYNLKNKDSLFRIIGDVIYIDSLSTLDVIRLGGSKRLSYHIDALYPKLDSNIRKHEILSKEYDEKVNKFLNKIDELIGGVFTPNRRRYNRNLVFNRARFSNRFNFNRNNQTYSMKNSSSGLKQIGTIQMLLSSNILKENDFLIIDEPELNLHPEWQIRLAEILVLLVKEFNITLYLNSHSPHFIEALEVFSVKYGIKDQTRFYMTVPEDDSGKFNFKQLNYSNIDELYDDLGNPYDEIDKVRLQNNMKGL